MRGSSPPQPDVFFCRAANGALSGKMAVTLNIDMSPWRDLDSGDWRRRVQRGARDIMFAVALTVTAVVLIGVAWLGNHHGNDARLGPAAETTRR